MGRGEKNSEGNKAKHVLFGRTQDTALHRRLRIQAIVEGRTVSEVIEDALREYLEARPLDLSTTATVEG